MVIAAEDDDEKCFAIPLRSSWPVITCAVYARLANVNELLGAVFFSLSSSFRKQHGAPMKKESRFAAASEGSLFFTLAFPFMNFMMAAIWPHLPKLCCVSYQQTPGVQTPSLVLPAVVLRAVYHSTIKSNRQSSRQRKRL